MNPELIGTIDGEPHVVKLYFKSDAFSKARVDALLALLEATHGVQGVPGVLDVRRSKLYEPTRDIAELGALLGPRLHPCKRLEAHIRRAGRS